MLLRYCPPGMTTAAIVAQILDVAFPDAVTALDPTFGHGKFWDGTQRVCLTAHDLDSARAPHGAMDFTDLAYADESFDVVLLDPPHLADAGRDSIMGRRFGTALNADLHTLVARGASEAWRVSRLGCVIKVTDHVHGQRLQLESDWVRDALLADPYDVVHQVRKRSLVDPRWKQQLSAYSNGSTFLVFRHGPQTHIPR